MGIICVCKGLQQCDERQKGRCTLDESTEQIWAKNVEFGRVLLLSELTDAGLDMASSVTRFTRTYLSVAPPTINRVRPLTESSS